MKPWLAVVFQGINHAIHLMDDTSNISQSNIKGMSDSQWEGIN